MKTLLPALAVALLAGGAPDDDFRSERQILRHLTVKLAQFRSERTDTSELSASVSTLKSLLEQMTAQAADLKFQDGRVHGFEVTDLDPKSHEEERIRRGYGDQLKILVRNQQAFHAAHGPATPDNVQEVARCDAMAKKIQDVEVEANQKLQLALKAYAVAQKEYALLLDRQRELQTALDRTSAEFRSLRGRADTQLHSLESALDQARRAAGAARILESDARIGVQRPYGALVFDVKDGPPPVDLPDVATREGTLGGLVMPSAPSLRANAPQAIVKSAKLEALRLEGETLQLRGHELQVEKVRLFSAKASTSEEWTAYSRKVQELARDTAVNVIMTRPSLGGSELMDMDAMETKPQKEPPVPGKETQ
jgi:hypothetical protein